MPELPEVETIRRDLARWLIGRQITKARAYDEKILVDMSKRKFARRLMGKTVTGLRRWGKALIVDLSDDLCLLVHLRMTGRLYPIATGDPLPDHTRAVLGLDDGRRLLFVNVRRFGRVELLPSDCLEQSQLLQNLGIDAWTGELDEQTLADMLQRHTIPLKNFLMDQRHIAGIGNIYASEILHRCRIHPDQPANSLAAPAHRKLLKMTRRVLGEAIEHCGTTVSDYRTGEGDTGAFQRKLRVYGREGRRCRRRGCPGTIVRTTHAGRSTYFCPMCQKARRASAGAGNVGTRRKES